MPKICPDVPNDANTFQQTLSSVLSSRFFSLRGVSLLCSLSASQCNFNLSLSNTLLFNIKNSVCLMEQYFMGSQLLHSNNCFKKKSLLIYQSLMFNFRIFSLGTNNQLHLLPIKVLMAHQSKKKITAKGDYTSSCHYFILFYFWGSHPLFPKRN